jgi:hypothetical protein
MPNWVYCSVSIDEKHFYEVVKFMKSDKDVFDFNKLIPYPQKYIDLDRIALEYQENCRAGKEGYSFRDAPKDGFNQGGYEWCVENWGTKWGACETEIDYYFHTIRFDTAWAPPEPVMLALSKKFPEADIELYFEEEAHNYPSEEIVYKGGKEISRVEIEDIDWEADEIQEEEEE